MTEPMRSDILADIRGTRADNGVPRILVADAVTDRLRGMILSGELPDGTPLRQDALAENMSTSRIPVREALSRPESEGLVASFRSEEHTSEIQSLMRHTDSIFCLTK